MEIKILTNYDDNLWCIECKQKIKITEKFALIYDTDRFGVFEKCYHLNCLPENEEDNEIYISKE